MKSWIPIIIFLIAFSLLAFRKQRKKVQVVIIKTSDWVRTRDSVRAFVLPHIGRTLTVSQADEINALYDRLQNNLISVSKIDSVESGK